MGKDYLGQTLEEILTNKELYVKYPNNRKQFSLLPSVQMKEDKEELGKFWHNFNTLKKLKSNDNNDNILKKSILNKYLGMNYKDLYTLDKNYLERRNIETRIFDTQNEKELVLNLVLDVQNVVLFLL